MDNLILTSVNHNGIMELVLNYPEKHNCIGMDMLKQLDQAIDQAFTDPKVQIISIKGAGEKAFSTGANIKEFAALKGPEVDNWILEGNRIFNRIESMPKPTIAYITGYAMGGGMELALCCDFRIGSSSAILAFPEVRNGWLPGWGGMARLRRLVGEAHAKYFILRSKPIPPEKAIQMGILHELIDNQSDLKQFQKDLSELELDVYSQAKNAVMEERSTTGADLHYDVLAAHHANRNK